jgi:hypothetical protein
MKATGTYFVILVTCLVMGSSTFGQFSDGSTEGPEWQVSFHSGLFTEGTYLETTIGSERVSARTDSAWLVGVRGGADYEYWGAELSVAGMFADLEYSADPALMMPTDDDASMLLVDLNFLWYPTANQLAEGRIRPFVTIGPGVMFFNSDFDKADGESAFDVNMGGGVKFLLGEDGNPFLRFDYRWHIFYGMTSGLESTFSRQEITAGIGWRF